jgi:hypothetical protein
VRERHGGSQKTLRAGRWTWAEEFTGTDARGQRTRAER